MTPEKISDGRAHRLSSRLILARTLTILIFLLTLAAHARADITGVSSPIDQAPDRVEIEVALFAGGEGLDFFELCAREYEKLNPHVKVNLYGDPRIVMVL